MKRNIYVLYFELYCDNKLIQPSNNIHTVYHSFKDAMIEIGDYIANLKKLPKKMKYTIKRKVFYFPYEVDFEDDETGNPFLFKIDENDEKGALSSLEDQDVLNLCAFMLPDIIENEKKTTDYFHFENDYNVTFRKNEIDNSILLKFNETYNHWKGIWGEDYENRNRSSIAEII